MCSPPSAWARTISEQTGNKLTFRPVATETVDDFTALMGGRGGPSYCWCMVWRGTPSERKQRKPAEKRAQMMGRISEGVPVGLLGYLDDNPVAWVSIAPRETYLRLGGPEAQPGETIWSLACMFLKRPLRGTGLTSQLVDAAKDHAQRQGATVLEAYPVDPESPSYHYMGLVPALEKLGFTHIGRAGTRRHVMRLALG